MPSIIDVMLDLAKREGQNINIQQQNKMLGIKNQFLPRSLQLDQAVQEKRIPLLEAQTGLAKARIGKVPFEEQLLMAQIGQANAAKAASYYKIQHPGMQGTFAKAALDLENLKQQYGENHPFVKLGQQHLERLAQGNNGISISRGPGGEEQIQIGGSKNTTAGAVYQDKNGNFTIMPTAAQASRLQKQLTGAQGAEEGLKEIYNLFDPYLGAGGNINYVTDTLSNFILGDHDAAKRKANYNFALGHVGLITEKIISAGGLNGTEHAIKVIQPIAIPKWDDSVESYHLRIQKAVEQEKKYQQSGGNTLATGYHIPSFNNSALSQPALQFANQPNEKMTPNQMMNRYQQIQQERARRQQRKKNG